MPSWSDRPYRRSSISQLESLFRGAKGDTEALRTLDHELGHRTTERASRLRSMVAEGLAALRVKPAKVAPTSVVNDEAPITTRTSAEIEFPKSPARQPPIQSAPVAARAPESAAIPSVEDLGSLPSFPPPKGPNEPMAVLAAWTALEALSPQTYRRPEDLADGDRRCVADLSTGRVPWGIGERSRPKRQLYYQIVLGSIPMEQATEELGVRGGRGAEPARPRKGGDRRGACRQTRHPR